MAQSQSLSCATRSDYFRRADFEGLSWSLPADFSDSELEQRLFSYSPGEVRRGLLQPNWVYPPLQRRGCQDRHKMTVTARIPRGCRCHRFRLYPDVDRHPKR